MEIYDNILTQKVLKNLQTVILDDPNFVWYYGNTVYKGHESNDKFIYSWDHNVFNDGKSYSTYFDLIKSCLLSALDNANIDISLLYRIRVGCITITETRHIHLPHVDHCVPHKTGLLYLNDSNGPTVLYNEKYDISSNLNPIEYFDKHVKDNMTIQGEVEHKANRLLVFDGLTYHSSTTPTDVPRRVAINFNFI
jgi:hypothetical protein